MTRGADLLRRCALVCLLPALAGCSYLQVHSDRAAGAAGVLLTASKLELLKPEFLAGGLIAYAIYDPLAPNWKSRVIDLDDERSRFELEMKAFVTGGEGEARQVFQRQAREISDARGFAGFDILRYEEGIEGTRPFAHRVARGEVRFVRSRTWPGAAPAALVRPLAEGAQ